MKAAVAHFAAETNDPKAGLIFTFGFTQNLVRTNVSLILVVSIKQKSCSSRLSVPFRYFTMDSNLRQAFLMNYSQSLRFPPIFLQVLSPEPGCPGNILFYYNSTRLPPHTIFTVSICNPARPWHRTCPSRLQMPGPLSPVSILMGSPTACNIPAN